MRKDYLRKMEGMLRDTVVCCPGLWALMALMGPMALLWWGGPYGSPMGPLWPSYGALMALLGPRVPQDFWGPKRNTIYH